MFLIAWGLTPGLALTGKYQICPSGFGTKQGKIAGNQPCVIDGSSLEGHRGDVRSPLRGFAQSCLKTGAFWSWGGK